MDEQMELQKKKKKTTQEYEINMNWKENGKKHQTSKYSLYFSQWYHSYM